jgi:hypothetical protein
MMTLMRAVAVYLTLLVLLAISLGAGLLASGWPRWCAQWHLCGPGWPQHNRP